jgi:acetolactate synthase-1/2/3 large subunit
MKPLLLVGQGARGIGDELVPIVEKLNLPVATTWNAMDLIPYDHPLCVGRPGTVSLPLANWAMDNCTMLFTVGARFDNIVTRYMGQECASQALRNTVDIDPAELEKHRGGKILGDGPQYIRGLGKELKRFPDWLNVCEAQKYITRDYLSGGPISHYQLVEALSDLLCEGQLIVTGSSGLAIEAFYQTFRNKRGQRIFHTTGLGAMGYGLPSAIGACLASGRKQTVLFESDGSLLFSVQNLATIKSLNLPITVIVANNGGYASMRATQRNYFDGRYIATGEGIPNITDLSRAFGIGVNTVREARFLKSIAPATFPFIYNVILNPDEVLCPKYGTPPPMLKAA